MGIRVSRASGAAIATLAVVVLLSEAIGGGWGSADRRAEVLAKLPDDGALLINLDAVDLPSTTDMIRLGRRATPAIINGLVNSMSADVRAACAAVLTGTRDPRAVGALLDALDDPRHRVRALAITALGQLETREATPRLLALLDKPNASAAIKTDALRALGRLGDPRAIKPMFGHFEDTWDQAAQEALWDMRRHLSDRQIRRLVVAPLQAAAKASDHGPGYAVLATSVRLAADLEISEARPHLQTIYPLRSGLQNKIINALGRIGDKRAGPFLKTLLDPASPARLLNNVAFALDRLDQDVEGFLKEALADRRAYIRFNAAFVAGDLKKKALVPGLITALADPNDYVRSNAAIALGSIGDPGATAALEAASREKNPVVRGDAMLALARIDYDAHRSRLLAENMTSKHRGTRYKTIDFFVAREDPSVVAPVLGALDPDDYRDQELGLRMLYAFDAMKEPAATAFLLRAAAGGSHLAFVLLGRFADERARFALRQWLTQPGRNADQLLRIAGRMKDKESLPLVKAFDDPERPLSARLHAAFAQAAIAHEEAAGAQLSGALETAPLEYKRTAARLLTELTPSTVKGLPEALAGLLKHEDVYVRLYAARALLAGGAPEAGAVLQAELSKRVPFIRDEALEIVKEAPVAHREPLVRALMVSADAHLRRDLARMVE